MENVTESNQSVGISQISAMTKNIWIYGGGFIILFGTIGNLLSTMVMTRKQLRKHTTSTYLVILAVVDTAVLYTGLLRYWIREVTGVDIRNLSVPGCKLHVFLVYLLIHLEAWILVWITVERLVAIFVPHRSKSMFTKRAAMVQVTMTGFVLAAVNLHFFWTFDLEEKTCAPHRPDYQAFLDQIWHRMDLIISSFAPFTVMISMNVAIITRLLQLAKSRQRKVNHVTAPPTTTTKKNAMTTMLITVNLAFLTTTAPVAIYLASYKTWLELANTVDDLARLDLVWACVNMAAYTNNASNFLLYCVSSPTFKKELVRLICTKRYANRVQTEQTALSITAAAAADCTLENQRQSQYRHGSHI